MAARKVEMGKTKGPRRDTITAMAGSDNATAHAASEYDRSVRKSIPFYDQLHEATINVVSSCMKNPAIWIDVGCGTGTFVERTYDSFPTTKFILGDPSAAMLELAARKLNLKDRVAILKPFGAEQLDVPEQTDVVSAIQSLHYMELYQRRQAVQNCFRLLRSGGMFVTFENIRPLTEKGTEIGKSNWMNYQARAGKSTDEARAHVDRFGVEFFPITVEEHLKLLRETNFSIVELLWYSYLQAGFYCIK